jgi:mono/diheme cytochrome c family protein
VRAFARGACVMLLAGAFDAAAASPPAEAQLQLKDAPGREVAVSRCGICHSVEYLPANAPAMDRAAWQKSVQKMRERFGAPITDEEAATILDYLSTAYAAKS